MENKQREIKFRAWDKKKKMMKSDPYIYGGETSCEWDMVILNDGLADSDFVFVQFTGLKEKHGIRKIEGAIVKTVSRDKRCWDDNEPRIGYVSFENGTFIIRNKDHEAVEMRDDDYGSTYSIDSVFFDSLDEDNDGEVIGNIFENSNLLSPKEVEG